MRRFLIPVLLFTLPAFSDDTPKRPPTTAQAVEFARRWLDVQRMYDGIPGVSASIVHDQKVIWSGGSGLADPATNRAADANTLYSICSVSKLFTSLAVMQLRDEGKLNLDDPVSKHLKWFQMKAADEGRDATLRGILTHSAGIPRESDYPYWTGDFEFPTREQIVARVASQQPLYPSQRYFQYSNLGITLAGEVVSAVSGKPYEQYIRERILQPVGLSSTFTEIPLQEKGKRLAVGYSAKRRDGTRTQLAPFQVRGIAPAAGFASTATDLARFAEWQFRVLANKDSTVIDPRTLREMQRANWVEPDLEQFWGLGFSVWKKGEKVFVGHGGSCPGFRTEFMMKPDEKVAVAVLANASGVNTGGYAKAMYDLIAPTLKSSAAPALAVPPVDLSPYVGSYDEFPWSGETIFVAWGDDLAVVGMPEMDPFKELERLRKSAPNEFRRVRKDGSLGEVVRFEMGADGKATRVWWHSNPSTRMK
ncbi:MAG TPA: serine hydrolase [Thermoanaerobaculia bacterium]|nr:serine hydrolase [Thermoanaerobaculia bacterium]